jgi:hypothetical protein
VLAAWLGIIVAIRVSELIRDSLLVPLFGGVAGAVIGTAVSIVAVLAITQPLFRSYSGQWAGTLAWYGLVLAALTVLFQTLFQLYAQQQFSYEVLSRYNITSGELWPFVVVTIAITPLLWTRWSES